MSKEGEVGKNRICPKCKRLLESTWVACPYCGTSLPSESPSRIEHKLPPVCPYCKTLLKEEWKTCPNCGWNLSQQYVPSYSRQYGYANTPSAAWYLVPFFFGIIGGLIGYVGTRDRDRDMALNLLILGLIWSVILGFIYWVWITSLIH
jgi:RNA polymerase subunit RPABC4/transcription elongation factor Spt4